jgi:hypothetical protein
MPVHNNYLFSDWMHNKYIYPDFMLNLAIWLVDIVLINVSAIFY